MSRRALGRGILDAFVDLVNDLIRKVGSIVKGRLGVANLSLFKIVQLLLDLQHRNTTMKGSSGLVLLCMNSATEACSVQKTGFCFKFAHYKIKTHQKYASC